MDAFLAPFRTRHSAAGAGSAAGTAPATKAGGGGAGKAAPIRTLRVVSYNVDGLCGRMLLERAAAVTRLVVAMEPPPDVVALQEVVPATVTLFAAMAEHLGMDWYTVPAAHGEALRYFCALAVRRGPHVATDAARIIPFPTSAMGRHAVAVDVTMWGSPMSFTVSHLESLYDHSGERVRQWRMMAEGLATSRAALAVFTGDTNLRDAEVGVLAPGVADAWVAVGSPAASRWTWDLTINKNTAGPTSPGYRARFDRLFYRANPVPVSRAAPAPAAPAPAPAPAPAADVIDLTGDDDAPPAAPTAAAAVAAAAPELATWRATSFTLLGTEASVGSGEERMHPSDHFGICIDFALLP